MTINDEDWKARELADQYLHMMIFSPNGNQKVLSRVINIANQMAALSTAIVVLHWLLCRCNVDRGTNQWV